MKLPKKVKVSYLDYIIEEMPLDVVVSESKHGDCDHAANLIRVQVACHSPQQQANTLLHEITHAMFHMYGISLKSEEAAVTGLANAWCQVKRDNPEVDKFINGGLNGH